MGFVPAYSFHNIASSSSAQYGKGYRIAVSSLLMGSKRVQDKRVEPGCVQVVENPRLRASGI